jgi:CheY-like chemotaxis protein
MNGDQKAARDRLIRFGGSRLANELAAIYLEEMPRRLAGARAAVRDGDFVKLDGLAHGMKSSSAQLGATELAATLDDVEAAAERGDVRSAVSHLEAIEAQYATFAAWLEDQAASDGEASMATRHDELYPNRERPTVAVIEDNFDNRLLLEAILGDDYVIDEYATGADALSEMPAHVPDLVLLDVSLPGMDGLEVLSRMRGDPGLSDVPVVAVTAHAMAGDRDRYLAAGFDGYVAKPIVDELVLIETIEALLLRRRRGRRT